MIIGGSTVALISLLNSLNPDKYEVDLQLYRNQGPLLTLVPSSVNILPAAEQYMGIKGRLIKSVKFAGKGYALRFFTKKCMRKYTGALLSEFQSKVLSRRNQQHYDYAVGFLEGWSDWYLAFGSNADRKYAWLHSTYANITPEPLSELPWMEKVDKIVFVSEPCRIGFLEQLPQMMEKSITVANITDSTIIRSRSLRVDPDDTDYRAFVSSTAFKIITVCRLTIQVKGLDRIVNAAKTLKAQGQAFLWYIVGGGNDMERFRSMIIDANVSDCVVPIGRRMNPYPFMAAADVMCMPSRYEGKPITITESMILGIPPVVTEYLSAHEQIKEEEGVIVANTDEAIIPALIQCMERPQLLSEMRQTLRSREYGNHDYALKLQNEIFS